MSLDQTRTISVGAAVKCKNTNLAVDAILIMRRSSYMGERARNNIGNWPLHQVATSYMPGSRAFHRHAVERV